jgi:DNA/RNA-binding domain of Phe-tRNA-synthetase-like protein
VTELHKGFVEPVVAAEFPGLSLYWVTVASRRRASPRSVARRLEHLAVRYTGTTVVAERTKSIPHAYRAFFRQIGLDPDAWRIPSERVAVARLKQGGFVSVDLIADACLIALVETGVPVWPLDAAVVGDGGLGIRTTTDADRSAAQQRGDWLRPGTLAIADHRDVHCLLFGDPLPGHGVARATRRVALFAVGVDSVPAIHVEEALSICVELVVGRPSG